MIHYPGFRMCIWKIKQCVVIFIFCVHLFKFNLAELQTVTTCEGRIADLTCPTGYFMEIKDISFGRRSAEVCPHTSIRNTSCGFTAEEHSRFMKLAQTTCGGRRRCQLASSYQVFGDTCPGSYKYLVVNFTCEPDACKFLIILRSVFPKPSYLMPFN